MTTLGSLSQSMDTAVKHYSSLFKLPPYKKVLLLLVLTCMSGGLFPTVILSPTFERLVDGMALGVSLFFMNLIAYYAVSMWILRGDPIYDVRRTASFSLYCWLLWLFFIFLGVGVALAVGINLWWIRLCLLGFPAVVILRSIVLSATSPEDFKRTIVASIIQPMLCIIPFLIVWERMDYLVFLFLVFSSVVAIASSFFFISLLNSIGMQTLKVPSMPLFRAFLLSWVTDLNIPFEEFLEKMGENQDVEVFLIKFDSSKPKAVLVVPSVHPGPFKNIGSSFLPSMLKTALEKELGCVSCVPHGLLGHEFDLASQSQNRKVIEGVVKSADFRVSEEKATPFVKISNGLATACCQIFGNFAFLSFTLAPKTTEDLPQEIGLFVRQEAEKYGLNCCIIVNAHNSIDGAINLQEALESLKAVAAECLKKAISIKRLPFEIGASTVIPKEFGLRDGMGPGGITVVIIKVAEQRTAYVVIDGNNMVFGLREKILQTLSSIGIDEGEVFTTDTHSVNALIIGDRGYHPIGEAIDHEKLIGNIKETALTALSSLEHAKAACRSITVSNVKVIGESLLETLCLLIDKTLQKAKKIAIPIFAASGLLLMLILMFV